MKMDAKWTASEYEKEALRALRSKDMEGFPEAMAQLHFLYQMNAQQRKNRQLMTGLHLMYLLVKNDRKAFHTLLKSLDDPDTQSTFISLPVQLEQSFDQGRYNHILLSEANLPDKNYQIFIPILTEALRQEIAQNMEVSYHQLNVKSAKELLLFQDDKEVQGFAAKRGWKMTNGDSGAEYQFPQHGTKSISASSKSGAIQEEKPQLDSQRIARQLIGYAKELEKIV